MFDKWLDDATPADLEALADGLVDGRISALNSSASILHAGFDEGAVLLLAGLERTDPKIVAWMLRTLATERRAAGDRYARVAQLVWSGEAHDDQGIRDTRVVLDDVFRKAQRHVLVATFVIYDGLIVFRTLAEQMRALPGLAVDLYVNLSSNTGAAEDEAGDVSDFLRTFRQRHWPSDVRLPRIFFDPETRKLGSERLSLHAKCVVVDEMWAFVTSANFTAAAQERNVEVGVLLEHPRLAKALAARFQGLQDQGAFREMANR